MAIGRLPRTRSGRRLAPSFRELVVAAWRPGQHCWCRWKQHVELKLPGNGPNNSNVSETPFDEREEHIEGDAPGNDGPYGWLLNATTPVWQILGVLAVCLGICVWAIFDVSGVLEHRKGPIALLCAPLGAIVGVVALVRAARRGGRK